MRQVDIYDVIKTPIKNAFTGEPLVDEIQSIYEEKRKAGLALKAQHERELVAIGEPHPITGEYQMRPKSVGTTYDIPPDNGSYCPDQVDRAGADWVDINELMKKYDPAGKQFSKAIAQGLTTDAGMRYDNFIDAPTFQQAQDNFIHGQQQFEMLPANLRNRFENDPVRFLEWVNNKETLEEQYSLGIRIKKVEPPKDATLKDVVDALQAPSKGRGKGGEGGTRDGDNKTP